MEFLQPRQTILPDLLQNIYAERILADFEWREYLRIYPDVAESCWNEHSAKHHFLYNGYNEKRLVLLAQKARAAGIHLMLATQRPDAKTFSGLVRSNIPARIALTVQKSTESNIILDESGAEDLLGSGDMLVKARPGGQPDRVHGVRIERSDIEMVLKDRVFK